MPDLHFGPVEAVVPTRTARLAPPADQAPSADRMHRRFALFAGLMSGSLVSRARDIVAANMTELLDRAEDPARMIRVIIAEMEDTLVEVRATAARSIADMKTMGRALERLDLIESGWTEKAEFALAKGRDDLARAALTEHEQAAAMAQGLRGEIDELTALLKKYEQDIARLQAKLREARARQAEIANRIEGAVARARVRETLHGGRAEAAVARFEQLERRADLAQGMADALGMTGPNGLEEDLIALRTAEKVDAALDELKAARAARH